MNMKMHTLLEADQRTVKQEREKGGNTIRDNSRDDVWRSGFRRPGLTPLNTINKR